MRVNFDNNEYVVDDDTMGFISSKIRSVVVDGYAGVNETFKFMIKALCRKVLYDYEHRLGSTLLDYPIRPSKGDDPAIHLIDLTLHLLRLAADNATITIKSENSSTSTRAITSLTISDSD